LSKIELEDFILKAIVQTLGASKAAYLSKTTDLFAFGVDSLQATRIRNICQKELELNGKTLGQNSKPFSLYLIPLTLLISVFQTVVYENPSTEKYVTDLMRLPFYMNASSAYRLATYIWSVRYGMDVTGSEEHQHATMLDMVEKWTAKFDLKRPLPPNAPVPRPVSHVIVRPNLIKSYPHACILSRS
jgi:hypothetical protein